MIAYANRPATPARSGAPVAASGEAAQALALAYLRYASACWRGEESAQRFATRLAASWRPQLPQRPSTPPHAYSPHGAGGRGITWYQRGDDVLGYIPACVAGYQVPIRAIQRLLDEVSGGAQAAPSATADEVWGRGKGRGAPGIAA